LGGNVELVLQARRWVSSHWTVTEEASTMAAPSVDVVLCWALFDAALWMDLNIQMYCSRIEE
jgi:hypothetical protein